MTRGPTLLHKLTSYGIGGDIHSWITDFLDGRKQQVVVNGTASTTREVTSGIPQGSVLGPTLFVAYINDLPEVVTSDVYLFADDTKIFHPMMNTNDAHVFQDDLNNLHEWTENWLLRFHPDKCKIMLLGDNHYTDEFTLPNSSGKKLDIVEDEKDLGVKTDNKLNFRSHLTMQVNKSNKVLGTIRRTFADLNTENFKNLFKTMVRPHLEYAAPIWNPFLKKDIALVENVQRRGTKMIPGMAQLPYEKRLESLDLPSLQFRRLRGDMIEVHKILNYYVADPSLVLCRSSQSLTRGHQFKLTKAHCRLNIRQHSFSQRVINTWNNLPEEIVTAKTTNSFKNRLDQRWRDHPARYKWDYDPSII